MCQLGAITTAITGGTRRAPEKRGRERTDHLIALEEDDAATLVAGGEVVACGVELDGGDDVGCAGRRDKALGRGGTGGDPEGFGRRTFCNVLDLALVAEELGPLDNRL